MLKVTKASDGRSYLRVVIGLKGLGKFWWSINTVGTAGFLFNENLSIDGMVSSPVTSRI